MARKKPKKCRICRKSPVWRGGDVKDPGPFCKKCYHKNIWSPPTKAKDKASPQEPEPDYDHCPECGAEADVLGGGACPECRFEFNNALYWWFAR
jgi:hypothetical protein